jgi:hypothetical protein
VKTADVHSDAALDLLLKDPAAKVAIKLDTKWAGSAPARGRTELGQ